MTDKFKERLIYNGEVYMMATEPLGDYLKTNPPKHMSDLDISNYNAKWEILDGKLFLVQLDCKLHSNVNVGVSYFFNGKEIVFASWFNGEIRMPHGKLLERKKTYWGDYYIYEIDFFVKFQNGILESQYEVDNRKSKFKERLLYNGQVYMMATEPMGNYMKTNPPKYMTALNRHKFNNSSYNAKWEIIDGKLFLVELDFNMVNMGVNDWFPGEKNVFASWFSGVIRIPLGKFLEQITSWTVNEYLLFEKDFFMVFENGVLQNQYEVENIKEYEKRLERREQIKKENRINEAIKMKKDKFNFIISCVIAGTIAVLCIIVLYNYFKAGTILSKIMPAWIFLEIVFILVGLLLLKINEFNNPIVARIKNFILNNLVILGLIIFGSLAYYLISKDTIYFGISIIFHSLFAN